tara:strand:- start:203 stop:853 length:651 start_codon:yes stop_codon:yes gene_type:complete
MKKIKNQLDIKILMLFLIFIIFIPLILYASEATRVVIPSGLVGYNAPSININIVIQNIINGVIGALGSITLLMFVVGGLLFILAGGNSEKIMRARNILKWALLGMFIVLFSYLIISFIFRIVGSDSGDSGGEVTGPICPCYQSAEDNGPICDNENTPTQEEVEEQYGVKNCDDYSTQKGEAWACRPCVYGQTDPQVNFKRGLCPSYSAKNIVCTEL